MKVLLDESLPKRLKKNFKGYTVKTVPDMGWQGKKNGELIKLMHEEFDVFLTADQNISYQINLRNVSIPVIVLASVSNRYEDLVKLVAKVLKKLSAKNLDGFIKIE